MPGLPETTSGFLLAVRDCCLALASDIKVPGPIIEELGKRGGLDPGVDCSSFGWNNVLLKTSHHPVEITFCR